MKPVAPTCVPMARVPSSLSKPDGAEQAPEAVVQYSKLIEPMLAVEAVVKLKVCTFLAFEAELDRVSLRGVSAAALAF